MAKRGGGGKFITGFLCFILGFIICLVVEVGIIAGGAYWLYKSDLEGVLSTLGIDNTEDDGQGNTKYIYIDTSEITSVSALVSELKSLSEKGTDALTLNDLEFLPIIDSTIDDIYSALADALGIDVDEVYEIIPKDDLKATALSELGEFINDCIDNIKVSVILSMVDGDWQSNSIYLALAYGSQAATVTVGGEVYYLYYNTFTSTSVPSEYGNYLYKTIYDDYRIYYYFDANDINDTAYIVYRGDEGYIATDIEYTLTSYIDPILSGGYYYDDSGKLVTLTDRTIGDILADDGVDSILYDIYLSDLNLGGDDQSDVYKKLIDTLSDYSIGDLLYGDINLETLLDDIYVTDLIASDDELIADIFDGITIGDLMSEDFDFEGLINGIYVGEFLEADPDNAIMAYIGYSVTELTASSGYITYGNGIISYSYTATLHLYTEDGMGSEVDTEYDAYVVLDSNGNISEVYYDSDGYGTIELYEGVTIGEISDQANRLTTSVKIKDLIDLSTVDSSIADKLGDYTIDNIGDFLDDLTLADAIGEVEVDGDSSTIMMYIVYGISDLEENNGVYTATYHTYTGDTSGIAEGATVYVTVENGKITGVYSDRGYTNAIGTPVNDVSARMDGIMSDLTIGDIADLGDSALAEKLNDYKISDLDKLMDELYLSDVIEEVKVTGDSSAIMMYIVYGINGLEANGTYNGYNAYTATYHTYTGDTSGIAEGTTVYVLTTTNTSGDEVIYGVYTDTNYDTKVYGTLVNNVSDRIDGLMNDLKIGEITTLGDSALEQKLEGYTINQISQFVDELTLGDVMEDVSVTDDSHAIMDYLVYGLTKVTNTGNTETIGTVTYTVYTATYTSVDGGISYSVNILADSNGNIYGIYNTTDSTYSTDISAAIATSVNDINTRMNGLMEDLTIGEIATNIGDSAIEQKLKGYTINQISQFVDELTLGDVIEDVSVTDDSHAIMDYLVYGLTKVTKTGNTKTIGTVTYTVYTATYTSVDGGTSYSVNILADSNGNIYGIYNESDSTYSTDISATIATSVNDINTRMNGLMNDLTIGEITDLGISAIAQKLSDYKISEIDTFLDSLTLDDVMDEVSVTDKSHVIMDYLIYGLTEVTDTGTVVNTDYTLYTAICNPVDGSTAYNVNILADSNGNIYGIYNTSDSTYSTDISGTIATPVDSVSTRMDGLMDTLTIGELIMDTSGSTILGALSGSTINSLSTDIANLSIQEVFYEDVYAQAPASVYYANVEEYLKLDYASIEASGASGTYYLYTETTVTYTSQSPVTSSTTYSFETYSGSDITEYIAKVTSTEDTSAGTVTTVEYSIYWIASNGTTYYQVVAHSDSYLFMTSSLEYVTYDSNSLMYTYGELQGAWYFMLHKNGVEQIYTIDQMGDLIDNTTDNLEVSSLDELVSTGIITSEYVEENLDKTVLASVLYKIYEKTDADKAAYYKDMVDNNAAATVRLGTLTLAEAMDVLVYFIAQ